MFCESGELSLDSSQQECRMICMSIIYAHDAVMYNFVNIIQQNNYKINHLVLLSSETHERSFVFSC